MRQPLIYVTLRGSGLGAMCSYVSYRSLSVTICSRCGRLSVFAHKAQAFTILCMRERFCRVVRDLLLLPIGVFLGLWARHTVSMSQYPMHDVVLLQLSGLYLTLLPARVCGRRSFYQTNSLSLLSSLPRILCPSSFLHLFPDDDADDADDAV